ncbi:metal-dependent hydrolase [Pseudonocardia sp. GCM10023141]|uniref:cysteine dioxygenase family protein n=1 Tax=Pseudonocardia sp. GCM10023141 TaxID=3252653 RepID=UPI003617E816
MSSAGHDVFTGDVFLRRLTAVADHGRGPRDTARGMAVQLRGALDGGLLDVGHLDSDADRYRQHLLHVDPRGRFSVVALVWRPGQATAIHDHLSWCVSGVHSGTEREERFALVDRCEGDGLLRSTVSVVNGPGVVSVLDPSRSDIHRVVCVSEDRTVSVHIYGVDLARAGTSIRVVYDDGQVVDPASERPQDAVATGGVESA